MIDAQSQLVVLLNADHAAVFGLDGSADGFNQLFGLAGTLQTHDHFNHMELLLIMPDPENGADCMIAPAPQAAQRGKLENTML
jgi:hypothetical protein